MTGDRLKLIKKAGRCVRPAAGKDKGEWKILCQGCGKEISSQDPDDGIEFTVTKKKSVYFFHTGCLKEAMNSKIKWNNK